MQQGDLFSETPGHPRPGRVVIIDGHHLAYRNYFALEKLTTSKGEPVQAIFGFVRTLLKLLREDGDCVIVVFDPPTPTFRHESYEAYKAGRAPTPEDFRPQLAKIKDLVELLGLSRLEVAGFEADDVIGALAKQAESEGYPVRIVTGDRDSFQLLSDQVRVILPDGTEVTPATVKEKYQVSTAQWVDYRSLTGDSSDNIPGAKGVGPKTAVKLLSEWGSLDNLLANLERVEPAKTRDLIQQSLENVRLSRELSRIHTEIGFKLDFRDCHRREPKREALKEMLEQLEFGSVLRELGLLELPKAQEVAPWPPPGGAFLGFVLEPAEPMWAALKGLAASDGEKVYFGPARVEELKAFDEIRAIEAKDLSVLAMREGLWLPPGDDPMLLAYLYDSSNGEPAGTVRRYGAGEWSQDPAYRAQAAAQLWQTLNEKIAGDEKLLWLYREIEKPLSVVLATMEARGVALDVAYLGALSADLGHQIEGLEAEIHRLAGHPFNVNSRDQLEKVLFDELKLSASNRKTSTGKRSTAASALEALLGAHPVIELLMQYRELTKLKNTYLDPLPKLIHPKTGRLHTRFNQTVAATGRLSSSDPNLQNIPIRTPLGSRIRKGFVAGTGMKLVVADYSQIELRVLAHLSGDEKLAEVFHTGRDIHTQTAAWMFGLRPEEVKPEMRRAAKTINFGVLYGMGAFRLSNELAISHKEAEEFIERYFASFPKVRSWIEATLEAARKTGYVETLFGRKRYISDLDSRIRSVREAAERMAVDMPVQGTATGDLMKLAMVKLNPKLEEMGATMLIQVHDEIIIEAPEDRALQVAEVVKETMETAWEFSVPLEAEAGIGENWLEAK